MILRFRADKSWAKSVKKQSDQGLHCLPFHPSFGCITLVKSHRIYGI